MVRCAEDAQTAGVVDARGDTAEKFGVSQGLLGICKGGYEDRAGSGSRTEQRPGGFVGGLTCSISFFF